MDVYLFDLISVCLPPYLTCQLVFYLHFAFAVVLVLLWFVLQAKSVSFIIFIIFFLKKKNDDKSIKKDQCLFI